jgi:hypothetical protein
VVFELLGPPIFAIAGRTPACGCARPALALGQPDLPTQDHERLKLRQLLTLHRRRGNMVTMSAWWRQQPEVSQDGESYEPLDIQVTGAIKDFTQQSKAGAASRERS